MGTPPHTILNDPLVPPDLQSSTGESSTTIPSAIGYRPPSVTDESLTDGFDDLNDNPLGVSVDNGPVDTTPAPIYTPPVGSSVPNPPLDPPIADFSAIPIAGNDSVVVGGEFVRRSIMIYV